jgi:hypothetical protein
MREYNYNKLKNYIKETLTPTEKLTLLSLYMNQYVDWIYCSDQRRFITIETPFGDFYGMTSFEQLLYNVEIHREHLKGQDANYGK